MTMEICFEGLDNALHVVPGRVFTLEVHNRPLFARICQSLFLSSDGCELEACSVWGADGEELRIGDAFLAVASPLCLPWDSKELGGSLIPELQTMQLGDDSVRNELEEHFNSIARIVFGLSMQMEGEYAFGIEWDLKRYLRAFGFSIDPSGAVSLLEKWILFLDVCADMHLKKVVLVANLKTFLSESEIEQLFERVFFQKISLLLLENAPCEKVSSYEDKIVVDQHFLEH